MNTSLILKKDGLISACRLPEEPGLNADMERDEYFEAFYLYEQAYEKAIKEAVLCADQEQAMKLIVRENSDGNLLQAFKKDTSYIIPGLDFEIEYFLPWSKHWVTTKQAIFNREEATDKRAILILPKQEEQESLINLLIRIEDFFDDLNRIGGMGSTVHGMIRDYQTQIKNTVQHYTISKKQ